MNDIPDSLVEKIKKLLRLSTSENEFEASQALNRAKKLCIENDIQMASIEAFEPSKQQEPVIKGQATGIEKRLPLTDRYCVHIIQDHFKCKIIYSGSRWSGRQVTFVGKKSDVEICQYMYGYLNQTFQTLWKKYYNSHDNVRLEERGSFFYGLQVGLSKKLEESNQRAETEKFQEIETEKGAAIVEEVKNNYALMRITDEKRVDDGVKQFYPHLKSRSLSYIPTGSRNAYNDGVSQGRKISLHKPLAPGNQTTLNN